MNMYEILKDSGQVVKEQLTQELLESIKDNKTYGLFLLKIVFWTFFFISAVMFGVLLPIKLTLLTW